MKKIAYSIACALMVLCSCCAWGKGADNDKGMIVGAYLMGVRNELPDVNLVTSTMLSGRSMRHLTG